MPALRGPLDNSSIPHLHDVVAVGRGFGVVRRAWRERTVAKSSDLSHGNRKAIHETQSSCRRMRSDVRLQRCLRKHRRLAVAYRIGRKRGSHRGGYRIWHRTGRCGAELQRLCGSRREGGPNGYRNECGGHLVAPRNFSELTRRVKWRHRRDWSVVSPALVRRMDAFAGDNRRRAVQSDVYPGGYGTSSNGLHLPCLRAAFR